jgi:hypothetical protein
MMVRTTGRRWKGCRLRKPHQDVRNGAAYRMPGAAPVEPLEAGQPPSCPG